MAELWARVYNSYFLPGDYALDLLSARAPGVAEFLGFAEPYHGSVPSGVLSACVWLTAIACCGIVAEYFRRLDNALTAYAALAFRESVRGSRIARRRFATLLRVPRRARGGHPTSTIANEIELNDLETAVLRVHGQLRPGFALTASDVSGVLRIRASQAQRVLERLKNLHLLDRAFGTSDGEGSYLLSGLGKALLTARGIPLR
jgi:hypothetical protein